MKTLTKAGNIFIVIVASVFATVLFFYGVLMLWDMFCTEIKAFTSYDLLKYRPNIEENEPPYLDDLLKINKDTAAWITLYNTNIDYPIMHGDTDDEYLNKDVYGKYAMCGSIFMSSRNSKDFSDPYTLIMGHHMENGSMFGDIVKYKEKSFFQNNQKGVLIMPDKVYNLRVMACFETDAYDRNVYRSDKTQSETNAFVEYVQKKSKLYRDKKYQKIIVLSTCNDAVSWGRTIVVCAATKRKAPLPDREEEKPPVHRKAIGHPMAGAYWALLNLVTMLCTVYIISGILWQRRKNLRNWKSLIEAELMIASIFLFIITEDLHKPIQLTDAGTLGMISIRIMILLGEKKSQADAERKKK